MEKMIPLNKQSKKAKKRYYARQRGLWHDVNPVTKISQMHPKMLH